MKTKLFIIVLLFANFSCVTKTNKSVTNVVNVCLDNTEQFSIESKYVSDENYLIQVGLPIDYSSSSKSYPVLYVLDGDKSFGIAKGIADWLMWSEEIKDIIVIGISYGQGTDVWWEKRARDYTHCNDTVIAKGWFKQTGGADNYLKFIQNEVFPVINRNYRIKPDSSAISGLSFGGMLGSYILFTQPEMFNGYIILAPSLGWNDKSILKIETEYFNNHKALNKTVFIAYGSLDDKVGVINPTDEFISLIKTHNYEGLEFIPQIFESESHISVYGTALTNGLITIFKR